MGCTTHYYGFYNPLLWVVEYWLKERQSNAAGRENVCRNEIQKVIVFLHRNNNELKKMNEQQNTVSTDSKSALNDKKLFIETYGCQMNTADSEVVASIMQMDGFTLTDKINEADAIFVNTCSIRDNAEQKVIQRLKYFQSLKKHNKRLVIGVIGCMAERMKDELLTEHKVNLVAGPDAYLDLPNLIGTVEQGEKAINVALSTTETYRDALNYCGSHSGRDGNKVQASGLTPITTPSGSQAFSEAWMIIECRKMVEQQFTPEAILDPAAKAQWGKEPHKMFIGEIINIWVK